MRRGRPHPSLTSFRLCKEFGWTPLELDRQPCKTIEEFIVIINELDRQAEEERKRLERETKRYVR